MRSDFGLIGYKLSHSFSKSYFEKKFQKLGLTDHYYHLFEIDSVSQIRNLLKIHPFLKGLNVTIPYKEDVMETLDDVEDTARRIGSVNVIKIDKGKLTGFNTDYYGFLESLKSWIPAENLRVLSALVLGSGGAAKAVCHALEDLHIPFSIVSRKKQDGFLGYQDLKSDKSHITKSGLIVNTTPLGMYPDINTVPELDFTLINSGHYVYDLVYNPEKTQLMSVAAKQGATTKNGLEMLHLQAEKSWELWNE